MNWEFFCEHLSFFILQKIRYKKRLRAANAKATEVQQSSSLKIIELSEEIAELKARNDQLPGTEYLTY